MGLLPSLIMQWVIIEIIESRKVEAVGVIFIFF